MISRLRKRHLIVWLTLSSLVGLVLISAFILRIPAKSPLPVQEFTP